MNPMKKIVAVSVFSVALLVPGISQASEMKAMAPTMMQQDKMTDSGTKMEQEGTMDYVPLRMFAETLGYKLMWNKNEQSITLTFMGLEMNTGMGMGMDMDMGMDMGMGMGMDMADSSMSDSYTVKIMLNSKEIMIGMDKKMLKQAPMLMNGKTCVTKDFIAMYLLPPIMMSKM